MLSEILHTLSVTWGGYFGAARAFLPQLVCASSVIAVGWLIAAAARFVTARVLRWIRFSHVSERTGAAELLRQAELPPAERLVPSLVFWLLFLGFLLSGIDGLGFQTIQVLREQATLFVPRLVGAAAIVSVGLLLASFVGRLVLLATCNAGWRYCRLASRAVQGFLIVITVVMALDQLRVARSVVLTTFAIAFGAVMLGFAVALGVASAPLLRRMLEETVALRPCPRQESVSHI